MVTPGGGLAGMAGRLTAVDGGLSVDSPPGGPTTVTAVIPCGS
jgi:signal transduction histidine kinase